MCLIPCLILGISFIFPRNPTQIQVLVARLLTTILAAFALVPAASTGTPLTIISRKWRLFLRWLRLMSVIQVPGFPLRDAIGMIFRGFLVWSFPPQCMVMDCLQEDHAGDTNPRFGCASNGDQASGAAAEQGNRQLRAAARMEGHC